MGWLLFISMFIPLRALGYNPLSASCDERLVDILDEAANFDIIMLAGTGRRFQQGIENCRRASFNVFSCGYARSPLTNKSCGVLVAIGPRFQGAKVYEPTFAGGSITGRGIAVRFKNSIADITAISLYFPPVPWSAVQQVAYKETVKLMIAWLQQLLDNLPGGTLPIIYADVNDGMGKKRLLAT